MKKKLLSILSAVGAAVVLPVLALAAFNDVQFNADAVIPLSDGIGSVDVNVTSGSQVASTTIAAASIGVGLESGSAITFMVATPTRRALNVSPVIATAECTAGSSTLRLTSATTQSVTVSMGDTCIMDFVATAFHPGNDVTVPLVWSGSSTMYTVTTSLASNGNFVKFATTSALRYIVPNLVCGTTYIFTVEGQTGGIFSNRVTSTAKTQLCAGTSGGGGGGGGGGAPAPAPAPAAPVATTTTVTATSTKPVAVPLPAGAGILPVSCPAIVAGDMVKVIGKPAIYAVDKNFLVLYFPSGDEFKSWNADEKYTGYTSVSQTCFDDLKVPRAYPGAVNFRPGSYVVKRSSSDQLYVVLPGNTLSKITASAAKALYGSNFKAFVVADAFWPHYTKRGADITEGKPHQGMVVSNAGKNWYVDANKVLREVTANGFTANRFKQAFVRPVTTVMIEGYTVGSPLNAMEAIASNRTE